MFRLQRVSPQRQGLRRGGFAPFGFCLPTCFRRLLRTLRLFRRLLQGFALARLQGFFFSLSLFFCCPRFAHDPIAFAQAGLDEIVLLLTEWLGHGRGQLAFCLF